MSAKKRKTKEKSEEVEGEVEGGGWSCTVCTYRNKYEAFKCDMCDTRKGTSTRKPRLNSEVQQMHSAVHHLVLHHHQKLPGVGRRKTHMSGGSPSNSRHSPESTSSGSVPKGVGVNSCSQRLKRRRPVPIGDHLISRVSPRRMTVTVKGVPALITEFRPKNAPPP